MQQLYKLAVIGNPIEHSRSPQIWREFAKECAIKLEYDKIFSPLDDFEHIVSEFFRNGGLALNVTAPFKERAYTLANTHHHDAMNAKSANLLVKRNDLITAYNTDGIGLVTDIGKMGISLTGKRILILGSGGVVHAVMAALVAAKPKRIDLLMRNWDNLDDFMELSSLVDEYDLQIAYEVVINTTPNTADNQLFAKVAKVSENALVYDMIYSSDETLFMQAMKKLNPQILAVNGLGMLIEQAAAGFAIVFGSKPSTEHLCPLLEPVG